MYGFMVVLVFLLNLNPTYSTWFFKEAKHCNPTGRGLLPFSGFKIYREFQFQGYMPLPIHYLKLIHCDHGKVDYQAIQRTPAASVDWLYSFCMLKPKLGKLDPLPAYDTVDQIIIPHGEENAYNQMRKPRKGGINLLQRPTKRDVVGTITSIKNLLQHKAESNIEKATKGGRIQYTGSRLMQHFNDIGQSSSNKVLEWESRDLVCYKMARRKKYAKSNISYYIPDTFVGALYECPISTESKRNIIRNMTNLDILQPLEAHFECDESTARPILPLIGDVVTNQWIEFKPNPLKPVLFQTIPFLTTSTPMNLRFSSSTTPDMNVDSWASKIHVNEKYDFSLFDAHIISNALSKTSDFLNKLIVVDLSKISFDFGKAKAHKHEEEKKNSLVSILQNFTGLEERVSIILGLLPSTIEIQKEVQKLWDNVTD